MQNVSDDSIIHIQHGSTSHVAWKNLEAIQVYEDKSQETAIAIIQNLWHTTADSVLRRTTTSASILPLSRSIGNVLI
jgi:hypothetical protein